MPRLWSHLFGSTERMSHNDWAEKYFSFDGHQYFGYQTTSSNTESIDNDFVGYVNGAYKSNGIVFACNVARMRVFSQARFIYQKMNDGRPGDLFHNEALAALDTPWPTGTTGDLLSRAIQDADLGGNHYALKESEKRIRRLRPDWVDVLLTVPPDEAVKSDIAGHIYKPGGTANPDLWEVYPIDGSKGVIAHWAPTPDPDAQYRGMSWLTPVLREISADKAATVHKGKFFTNAATPNLAISLKETVTKEQFKEFMQVMNSSHVGAENAYKNLYLGGGADVTVVGANLKQLDFKVTQGAGETRIAAAARIHPVLVGLSEGMQGSSLNAGNFRAAREAFGDGEMRSLWQSICSAYAPLVRKPPNGRLWYDDRDIPFLREDRKVLAEIQGAQSETISRLVMQGYTPESVVAAVQQEDWRLLKHTGLYSVQLQPPMPDGPPEPKKPAGSKEE